MGCHMMIVRREWAGLPRLLIEWGEGVILLFEEGERARELES